MSSHDPANAGQGRTSILNVGTRILLKDVMDQYFRTLGEFATHYASNMSTALRAFQENQIHIVIAEVDLVDGSVFRLVKELGGPSDADDELYFIVALEQKSPALEALAQELEVDAVLYKPFAAADLKAAVDKYLAWKAMPKDPWRLLVAEARFAVRERRYRDAEMNFQEAAGAAPTNPAPLVKAAQYYAGKPDPAMTEQMLKRALALNPNHVTALSMLGTLYVSQHNLDHGEALLTKAQQLSPLNPDRSLELVRLYLERSIDACKSAARIDASNTASKLLLGKLLAIQKDYVGAVRELERILPGLRDVPRNEAQTFAALARKLGGIAK
ncbi:MAG: hypothetical protein HY075_04940 [Deltaproteobacteria bacterium]|nr:hypothetical protein [Deltaproteobacteria bacterium]